MWKAVETARRSQKKAEHRERMEELAAKGVHVEEEESSSSSDSEIEAVDTEGNIEHYTRWPIIKELLTQIRPSARSQLLLELSRAMNEHAEKAKLNAEDLDELAVLRGFEHSRSARPTVALPAGEPMSLLGEPAPPPRDDADDAAPPGEAPELPHIRFAEPEEAAPMLDVHVVADDNDPLLEFRLDKMPAALAAMRCQKFFPKLLAAANEWKPKKKEPKRVTVSVNAELAELSSEDDDDDEDDEDDDKDEDEEEELEAKQRMRKLSKADRLRRRTEALKEQNESHFVAEVSSAANLQSLPHDATAAVRVVYNMLNAEIKRLNDKIEEKEHRVQVQKAALEYESKTGATIGMEYELVREGIKEAKAIRERLEEEKRAEDLQLRKKEKEMGNVAEEHEVQEILELVQKTQADGERAVELIQKLIEMNIAAIKASANNENESRAPAASGHEADASNASTAPAAGQRRHRAALVVMTSAAGTAAPQLPVPIEKAPEEHRRLTEEMEDLHEQVRENEAKILNGKKIIANAEESLKVLEETKTVFLESFAKVQPHEIKDSLEFLQDEDGAESTGEESDDTGVPDDPETVKQTKLVLSSIGNSLIAEIHKLDQMLEEEEKKTVADIHSHKEFDEAHSDRTFTDLSQLAKEVDDDQKELMSNDAQGQWRRVNAMSKGSATAASSEAIEQLRSRNFDEMSELLKTEEANEALIDELETLQSWISTLRSGHGDPDSYLKALAEGDAAKGKHRQAPVGLTTGDVLEVQKKVREFWALRQEWWRDRQDPTTTVRRSEALCDPADDGDQPPASLQKSRASSAQHKEEDLLRHILAAFSIM
eukprot:gnl/TRDRNA2_/TRDRNA2_56561_c0_seq1.p1 gnl/TRDRNA2_/TRDRNA2_56561_c0~~gnl/TRDRNA2_/TRDRNA2_56561_c0_seq1.p1  ORF type:complete len:964 (-),score=258.71 gnl/TRDRNA2_/TRDRNA2_56561_c0_seq1:130-2610(-)